MNDADSCPYACATGSRSSAGTELSAGQAESRKPLVHCARQPVGRRGPPGRELLHRLCEQALGGLPSRGERPEVEVGGIEQVQLGGGERARLEHGRRVGAVLLEQAVEQVAPALEFGEARRVVLHFLRIVGREARQLIEVGERGVEQLAPWRRPRGRPARAW